MRSAGAVERLRELVAHDGEEPETLVLAAADPAQPYGAAIPWPKRAGARAARVAGATSCSSAARRRCSSSAAAARSCRCASPTTTWLRPALAALVDHVKRGGAKRLAVERFDGEPVGDSEVMPLLIEAGFLAGPRRAVLRP